MLNKYIFIFLMSITSLSLAKGTQVSVFNKKILLPDNCILYARPSVLSSSVEFNCKKTGINTLIMFVKYEDINYDSYLQQNQAKLINKINDLRHIRFNIDTGDGIKVQANVMCDHEVCIGVHDSDDKIFNEIWKQVIN